jgi:hypothetical protein
MAPVLCRYAAIRSGLADEFIDLSTLSSSEESARNLAQCRDDRLRMEIRRGRESPYVRIARVRIEEVA